MIYAFWTAVYALAAFVSAVAVFVVLSEILGRFSKFDPQRDDE